jgi:phage tail sheath protein FI
VQETDSGTRYLDIADSSVVGIVCTGDDADDTKFPLDTPVLLTGVRDAASYAGDTGTLATSLEGTDEAQSARLYNRFALHVRWGQRRLLRNAQ